jgi:hypothetical protein
MDNYKVEVSNNIEETSIMKPLKSFFILTFSCYKVVYY